MSSGYVLAGYGITLGALGLYALRVLSRGRTLSRAVVERARPGSDGLDRPPSEQA